MRIRLEQKSGKVREVIRVLIYLWNHEYLKSIWRGRAMDSGIDVMVW